MTCVIAQIKMELVHIDIDLKLFDVFHVLCSSTKTVTIQNKSFFCFLENVNYESFNI